MPIDAADILDGLNEPQRRAVLHEGGPLLVLAGPGTGKTRVITRRIAHLIRVRSVEPESIVAVTFSVKAAQQLRDRLHDLIGPAADRVHARTFHGLGYRLIRRFGDMLPPAPPVRPVHPSRGASPAARASAPFRGAIIDSAQQKRMLRRVILERDLMHASRAEGVDSAIDRVIACQAALADLSISPADCARFITDARARLAEGGGLALDGSPLDATALLARRQRIDMLEEVSLAIEHFHHACHDAGLLTFSDLIGLPIRILAEVPRAAAIIRDEWRHLVVDELQDVNAAQIRLLSLLAPPSTDPDLCVVGDDDQSIYEFRGADDLAFQRFAAVWPRHTQVALTANYRSRREIVALAGAVISRADFRFAPDKVIHAAGDHPQAPADTAQSPAIQCVQLEDDRQDGEAIAAMLLLDRAANPARPWSSYAVVARSNADLFRVQAALEIEDIPVRRARTGSLVEDEGVKDVLAWIESLVEPRRTHAVLRLLHRPPFSIPTPRARDLERQYRALLSRYEAGDPGAADPGPFIPWLAAAHPDDHAITRLAALFTHLESHVPSSSAADLIERIIRDTDPAHADLIAGRERAARIIHLVTLIRFARQRQPRLDQPGDLRAFWAYWQDLDHSELDDRRINGSAESAESGGGGEGGSGGYHAPDGRIDGSDEPPPSDPADGVQLITAHGAKGLEFHTVFVPRVSPNHGYGKSGNDPGLDLPADLAGRAGAALPADTRTFKERRLAEERRIFYVACTRAESRLVLLSKKNKSRSKSTHFFEEIVHDPALKPVLSIIDVADLLKQAGSGGLGRGFGWCRPSRSDIDSHTASFRGVDHRRETFEAARRDLRASAAAALALADNPSLDPAHREDSQRILRLTSLRLSALAYAEHAGLVPPWAQNAAKRNNSHDASDAAAAADYAAQILAQAGQSAPDRSSSPADPGATPFPPPPPPLNLSYTYVRDYLSCPRCFYLNHILRLDRPPAPHLFVGAAVHGALEQFYSEFRDADSTGNPLPGRDRLIALGRIEFFARLPRDQETDPSLLDQCLAQLALVFDRLHDPAVNVVEIERRIEFRYGPHRMTAKLDRVDTIQLPDGAEGFRIVDYKSGRPIKSLLNPEPDDLQLGIYALALARSLDPDAPTEAGAPDALDVAIPEGFAEYWLLASGQAGRIALSDLDLSAVRAEIDKAVAGILAGRFDPKPNCSGDCRLFSPATPLP